MMGWKSVLLFFMFFNNHSERNALNLGRSFTDHHLFCHLYVCPQVRMKGQGSMCNQAIMLITDGAMEDYESVFEEFNWPERRVRNKEGIQ